MAMFDSALDPSEVILFVKDDRVVKEMMYTEFEAILDGVVGLGDFADQTLDCVYVVVNPQLAANAICCFALSFDQNGHVPSDWNIPFRSLLDHGVQGPDLGAGPVQLMTKSACQDPAYQAQMWDPSDEVLQEVNHILRRNRLCLKVHSPNEMPIGGFYPGQPGMQGIVRAAPGYGGNAMPVPGNSMPDYAARASVPPPSSFSASPTPTSSSNEPSDANKVTDIPELTEAIQAGTAQEDIDHLLKHVEDQHQERLKSLLEHKKQAITKVHGQAEKAINKYKALLKQERAAKDELKNQVAMLSGQISLLKDQNAEEKKQLAALKAELDAAMQDNHQQQLQENERSLAKAEATIKRMGEELAQLRRDSRRLYNSGADEFFKKLESVGLSFIAFHPGAGHVSVNLLDMGDYLENPLKFAARKCNISEQDYRLWLNHYESPKCQAPLVGDARCGDRIKRIEHPSNFQAGVSDRCDKHKTGFSASSSINRWTPPEY